MKQTKRLMSAMVAAAGVCLFVQSALANNLTVTNHVLQAGGPGYTYVKADIRWDNSWRASWTENTPAVTVTNWDAAWIFVKYRVSTNNAPWQHASLSTNNSEHIVVTSTAGATINVGTSANAAGTFGAGVFLYRSAEGGGNWVNTVKLRWNYAQDGVASTANIDVSVQAIEMVYVPQGSFKVGSGGTEDGTLTAGDESKVWSNKVTPSVPFAITSEASITISNAVGCLWGTGSTNDPNWDVNTIGSPGVLPAAYPKGYNAFYCMKYELSQGQWVSFFNMLTDTQKTSRDITHIYGDIPGWRSKETDAEWYRNTIAWTTGDATCTNASGQSCADRACNCLGWGDLGAYFDWAGLRPMTELEFEKACRGPLDPVPNEWANGTAVMPHPAGTNYTGGADGSGTETALNPGANCAMSDWISYDNGTTWVWGNSQGPVRCGIFAKPGSTRATSCATYWGIMEMSGNVFETAVTVANGGRAFAGQLGDGKLTDAGNADFSSVPAWDGAGCSARGGGWNSNPYLNSYPESLRISGRGLANFTRYGRTEVLGGGRGVRQASSVVQ